MAKETPAERAARKAREEQARKAKRAAPKETPAERAARKAKEEQDRRDKQKMDEEQRAKDKEARAQAKEDKQNPPPAKPDGATALLTVRCSAGGKNLGAADKDGWVRVSFTPNDGGEPCNVDVFVSKGENAPAIAKKLAEAVEAKPCADGHLTVTQSADPKEAYWIKIDIEDATDFDLGSNITKIETLFIEEGTGIPPRPVTPPDPPATPPTPTPTPAPTPTTPAPTPTTPTPTTPTDPENWKPGDPVPRKVQWKTGPEFRQPFEPVAVVNLTPTSAPIVCLSAVVMEEIDGDFEFDIIQDSQAVSVRFGESLAKAIARTFTAAGWTIRLVAPDTVDILFAPGRKYPATVAIGVKLGAESVQGILSLFTPMDREVSEYPPFSLWMTSAEVQLMIVMRARLYELLGYRPAALIHVPIGEVRAVANCCAPEILHLPNLRSQSPLRVTTPIPPLEARSDALIVSPSQVASGVPRALNPGGHVPPGLRPPGGSGATPSASEPG